MVREAFEYVSKNGPTQEEIALWSMSGWSGCKLWGACGGTRCLDGDPDSQGRKRFRTPVKLPRSRPSDCQPFDRRMTTCPIRDCEPWMWSAIHEWSAWTRFKSLPHPGSLSEQDARLMDAIGIIDSESMLISAHHSEIEMQRARRRSK